MVHPRACPLILKFALPVLIGLGLLVTPGVAQQGEESATQAQESQSVEPGNRKRRNDRAQQDRNRQGNKRNRNNGQNKKRDGGDAAQDMSIEQRLQRLAQLFRRMDQNGNGNGILEKSEVPARMQQRWDQMDSNGDGQLDREEIGQIVRQMRQRAQQMQNGQGMPGMGGNDQANNKRREEARKRMEQRLGREQQNAQTGGSVEPVHPGKKNG